jgi:hypothetical protein
VEAFFQILNRVDPVGESKRRGKRGVIFGGMPATIRGVDQGEFELHPFAVANCRNRRDRLIGVENNVDIAGYLLVSTRMLDGWQRYLEEMASLRIVVSHGNAP